MLETPCNYRGSNERALTVSVAKCSFQGDAHCQAIITESSTGRILPYIVMKDNSSQDTVIPNPLRRVYSHPPTLLNGSVWPLPFVIPNVLYPDLL
jgi:hypothetical protein